MGGREGGEKGDPLTVTQLLRGNLIAISSHKRKPRVAGEGEEQGEGEGKKTKRERRKERSGEKSSENQVCPLCTR